MGPLARGKDVVLRFGPVKDLGFRPQTFDEFESFIIHRNQSLSSFCLTRANQNRSIEEVDVPPL
jgi:hypothetical protein